MTGPLHNANVAADHAHVDQQIGTYHDDSVYNITLGDPPERRFEVARRSLGGGMPRHAERLMEQLLLDGHLTAEWVYYYVLSVFSDRTFNDIGPERQSKIKDANGFWKNLDGHDEWWHALEVVWRIVDHLLGTGSESTSDSTISEETVRRLVTTLPTDRQDEIRQHLDQVLSGALRDQLSTGRVDRLAKDRMRDDRADRAWLFFEPDPASPREYRPATDDPDGRPVISAVVAVLGLGLALTTLTGEPLRAALVAYALLLCGCAAVTCHFGWQRRTHALLHGRSVAKTVGSGVEAEATSPGHWVRTDWVRNVHTLVDALFQSMHPRSDTWARYTLGIRNHLKKRLVDAYGNANVRPTEIHWLIRWHARRAAAGWPNQPRHSRRVAAAAPRRVTVPHGAGVLGMALSSVLLVSASTYSWSVAFGVLSLVAGITAAQSLVANLVALRRANARTRADAHREHQAELDAYARWKEQLRARPTDVEMGQWLALDRMYLIADALRRAGLSSKEVYAHLAIAGRGPGSHVRFARVSGGPARWTHYVVQIFLLTRTGIRESRVTLDFRTGEVQGERRNLFHYEALASVSVTETSGRRLSRTLCLSLVNDQRIEMVAENYPGPDDAAGQETDELFEASVDSSGLEAGRAVLEVAAQERANWIRCEQERRERWSRDWSRGWSPTVANPMA